MPRNYYKSGIIPLVKVVCEICALPDQEILILILHLVLLGLTQVLLAKVLLVTFTICNHDTLLAFVAELPIVLAHLRLCGGSVFIKGLFVYWLQLIHLQSLLLLLLVIIFDLCINSGRLICKSLHYRIIDVLPYSELLATSLHNVLNWVSIDVI